MTRSLFPVRDDAPHPLRQRFLRGLMWGAGLAIGWGVVMTGAGIAFAWLDQI